MKDIRVSALKGYDYKYGNNKKYSFNKSIKGFKKTGTFRTRNGGSGHDAGFKWAMMKAIDPTSKVQKYGKNSPSFDEGVYAYKERARTDALKNAINNNKK